MSNTSNEAQKTEKEHRSEEQPETEASGNGREAADAPQLEGVDVKAIRRSIAERDEESVAAFDTLVDRAVELDHIQEELNETKDQLMRQVANFKNYRRRSEKEKERNKRQARGDVIRRMLDVLDDLGRSLESVEEAEEQDEPDYEAAYESLKEGVEMVYDKFTTELKRMDVEPIEAEGRPFDEKEHEAMMQQPAPEGVEEGTVLQEIQKGYRMGNRVLRHAKVIVAGKRNG